ncbi:hypothetical protein JVU11DRAFT_2524 [Chiua virens]|nr:hypothetical protein JVU11DRAFT_2524 [Chiua virens]
MDTSTVIEGRPVLTLPDSARSVTYLLQAFSFLTYDEAGFPIVASLLRVLTAYKIHRIRHDILRVLSNSWPTNLSQWQAREYTVTSPDGVYSPRPSLPHPVDVIKLARDINAPFLLPSAMYDLSRSAPSEAATGVFNAQLGDYIRLDESDLLCVLRGREHAARYFSTFIVNELEGRIPSTWCLRRNDAIPLAQRACQIAFEAITFELLRDINGIISHRTSDPLYAMSEAEAMQTRESTPEDGSSTMRTCEACRAEFSTVVLTAKEGFWRNLPLWFAIDVPKWG